jgi:hypothetical protein
VVAKEGSEDQKRGESRGDIRDDASGDAKVSKAGRHEVDWDGLRRPSAADGHRDDGREGEASPSRVNEAENVIRGECAMEEGEKDSMQRLLGHGSGSEASLSGLLLNSWEPHASAGSVLHARGARISGDDCGRV